MANPEVGWALRMARIDAELTQKRVAAALGLSVWSYNRMENGHQPFTSQRLLKLPEAMRKPVAEAIARSARRMADTAQADVVALDPPRLPPIVRPVGAAMPRPVTRVIAPSA